MPGKPDEGKRASMPPGTERAVRVTAPARLHLGFLDPSGTLGRRFGSIGLAVNGPITELAVARAPAFASSGVEAQRALKLLRRFAQALGLEPRYRVHVAQAIPAHAGLGSGTQLALGVGAGLLRLEGLSRSSAELGELVERGARSAIGMAAFETGGFIVDGGRGPRRAPPPLLMRAPFPDSWRALLVLDRRVEGVHGERETRAFAELPPFTAAHAAHLSHLTLMRLMPGLIEADLAAFGAAVSEIQEVLGQHFAAAQGGSPWTSPAVGRLVARLAAAGAEGIGQSSWGPTGFAFAASEAAAQRLYQSCVQDARAEGLELLLTRGRNTGARIELVATADLDT
jgi:beta-ribofuranosylaminobenzene 5'-phosphate synthase